MFQIPPTKTAHIVPCDIRNNCVLSCRLDLKDPPAAAGGIPKEILLSCRRWDLNHPPAAAGGIHDTIRTWNGFRFRFSVGRPRNRGRKSQNNHDQSAVCRRLYYRLPACSARGHRLKSVLLIHIAVAASRAIERHSRCLCCR